MAKYGFKLLRVKLFHGQGHTEVDFGPAGEPHYLDRVAHDILELQTRREADESAHAVEVAVDEETLETITLISDDVVKTREDEPLPANLTAKPPAVVRVEEYQRLRSALLMKIQYGVVGDHDRAVDPEGRLPDADLTGLATTRPYRALLIAPEHGTVGFLAVEVISRSHAGADLPRRLYQAAHGHNLKLRSQGAVADSGAVRSLVADGHVKEVELFKTFNPSDVGSSRTRRVKMIFPVTTGTSEGDRILSRVRGWVPKPSNSGGLSPVDAVAEAAALASILWSDAEQLAFDDARVQVVSDTTDRRLQPLDRTEGFTYDLGDEDLDDSHFVMDIASVAQSLFSLNEMDMENDWSDWLDTSS